MLKPIDDIPKDASPVQTNILAEGEQTGHHHSLVGKSVQVYAKGDEKYFTVKEGEAKLTHQEHNTVTIPEGDYVVLREKEYDPFAEEMRRVQD